MVENNFSIDADIKVSMVCLADSEYRVCLADSGSITNGSTKKSIKEIKLKKQPSKKSITLNVK